MSRTFNRYIGIDYSGAETPTSSLKGLRIYEADAEIIAQEVQPPPSPRKYWTRRGIAEWLVAHLASGPPTIVGVDHGFSFPLRYFERHGLPLDWPLILEDFQRQWPYVNYVLFILKTAYSEFEERVGRTPSPKGAKAGEVIRAVQRQTGDFRLCDIERACPDVGREWIRRILADMKERGEVAVEGRGPAARWRYVGMSSEGTTST